MIQSTLSKMFNIVVTRNFKPSHLIVFVVNYSKFFLTNMKITAPGAQVPLEGTGTQIDEQEQLPIKYLQNMHCQTPPQLPTNMGNQCKIPDHL